MIHLSHRAGMNPGRMQKCNRHLESEGARILNKMDLIDLYYPADETVAALLTVPPEEREALLRRILGGASETEKDPHISRSLGNDRCIRRQRSVMKSGDLSAFVLSQLYRWFPSVLTQASEGPAQTFSRWASPPNIHESKSSAHSFESNSSTAWGGCRVRGFQSPPVMASSLVK